MSELIRKSIGHIKCQAVGHDISIEDEDKLYIAPSRSITTRCSVCGKQVKATMNETNEDEYFVEEL
ncbi:MAG: hypothetical protein QXY15_07145 [Candidatus Nitrosotenuis sp.]